MGIVSFTTEAYARMQKALLPQGKAWFLGPDSLIVDVFLSAGDELARVSVRVVDLLRESDTAQAVELLPDYELELELPSAGTDSERQDRIVARETQEVRFRGEDVKALLAPYLDLDPGDIVIVETTRADAIALGDDQRIYQFFVYRNPALPGAPDLDAAQVELDRTSHSHTDGVVVESINFLCDDPNSLTDRDLLGV